MVKRYLVFVAVRVDLDAETGFLVHFPVADVSDAGDPLLALDGAILVFLLVLDPVDRAMGPVLLRLSVVAASQSMRAYTFHICSFCGCCDMRVCW